MKVKTNERATESRSSDVEVTLLRIDDIHFSGDSAIRARAAVDEETIAEYSERMTSGAAFPPIVVFAIDEELFCVDGAHRIAAARASGRTEIEAEVREGTLSEARAYAAAANIGHGLKRSNADKAACVELLLMDEMWRGQSANAIAIQAGVSQNFVVGIRAQLSLDESSAAGAEPVKRLGRDGKARPATYKKRKTTAMSSDEAVAQPVAAQAAYEAPLINEPSAVEVVKRVCRPTPTMISVDAGDPTEHGDCDNFHEPDGNDQDERGEEASSNDFANDGRIDRIIEAIDDEVASWPRHVQAVAADAIEEYAGRIRLRAAEGTERPVG